MVVGDGSVGDGNVGAVEVGGVDNVAFVSAQLTLHSVLSWTHCTRLLVDLLALLFILLLLTDLLGQNACIVTPEHLRQTRTSKTFFAMVATASPNAFG